jgi:hypothetical protein
LARVEIFSASDFLLKLVDVCAVPWHPRESTIARVMNTMNLHQNAPKLFTYVLSQVMAAQARIEIVRQSPSQILRAILDITPGPQGWNLSPKGNVHPFVRPHPGVNTLHCLCRRMEGRTENFTPIQGITSPPRGQNSPLWDKLAPGVKVCPWGQS